MSEFQPALKLLLKLEGGYVDDPNGGSTKFGISLNYLIKQGLDLGDINHDAKIDVQDIKSLTQDQAADIYQQEFWTKNNLSLILDQRLANMILSSTVNMGSTQAIKLLQRATNYVMPRLVLKDDGVLGPKTTKGINLLDPAALLTAYKVRQRLFYVAIVREHPNNNHYLRGWLARLEQY